MDRPKNAQQLPRTTIKETTAGSSPHSKSMHDGVEVWCDCCSCEAEPYWLEAMQRNDPRSGRD